MIKTYFNIRVELFAQLRVLGRDGCRDEREFLVDFDDQELPGLHALHQVIDKVARLICHKEIITINKSGYCKSVVITMEVILLIYNDSPLVASSSISVQASPSTSVSEIL